MKTTDAFKITARDIPNLPVGTHRVGDNLFVRVRPTTASYFLRIQKDRKRTDITIGSTKAMSLQVAKATAANLKSRIELGENVVEEKEIKKIEKNKLRENPLFREIIKDAVENRAANRKWKSDKHKKQWIATLETYASPVIGNKRIDQITRHDIIKVVKPIWETKHETASRLLTRIELVIEYAIFNGWFKGQNPATWRGNMEIVLPSGKRFYQSEHHEAITQEEAKLAAQKLFTSPYISYKQTLFGMFTACRVQEFCLAKWSEIDFENAIFYVPPERRKDSKKFPHRVALSRQAIELLKSIERTSEYVFVSKRTNKPMNLETPKKTLCDVVQRKVTMHGCRSTFKDWCEENDVPSKVSEKALMHSIGNETVEAYERTDLLEKRRPVMQAWADFLLGPED